MILTFHGYSLDAALRPYNTFLQNMHYQTDLRWFVSRGMRLASKITCVSRFTADLVKMDMQYEKPLRVIYNGIDEQRFHPAKLRDNKYFDVLFSGNLIRKKGGDLLPKILKKLDKNIRIFYTSGLRTRNLLPDDPRLVPIGRVPYLEMHSVYQKMNALLFPTVREGCPLVALEAMACGIPVVASNTSSLPEIMKDQKSGFLCEIGDVECFANALNHMANSPALCREMGQYNRNRIEADFTYQRMVNEYKDLFEETLS